MRLKSHSLQTVLHEVAALAKLGMPGDPAVSASLLVAGCVHTAAYTDQSAVAVDEAQYSTNNGPALDAMADGKLVYAADLTSEARWPDFAQAAVSCGVLSALSVPISVPDGSRTATALNIYSSQAHAFTEEDLLVAATFARSAEATVLNAHDHDSCRALVRQLATALETRPVIDQAKGIVMGVRGCTADEAFQHLVDESRRANRTLRDIARDVVEQVAQRA
jgi:GAF domain-containing protein